MAESKEDINLKLSGMTCANCALKIETKLNNLKGVKRAVVNFAYEEATEVEETIETKDPTNIIYGSCKVESEKALLVIDAKGNREAWIPKSCLKSGDKDSTKFVVHNWFIDNIKWSDS